MPSVGFPTLIVGDTKIMRQPSLTQHQPDTASDGAKSNRAGSSPLEPVRARLEWAATTHPDSPALRFFGRATSYRDYELSVIAATAVLRRLGAGAGVRVGIFLPNCPAIAIYYFAAFTLGASVVPLDPNLSEQALAATAAATGLDLLVLCDLAVITDKCQALTRHDGLRGILVLSYSGMMPMASALHLRILRSDLVGRLPAGISCPVHSERELLRDKSLVTAAKDATLLRPAASDDTALVWADRTRQPMRVAHLTHANLTANVAQICASLPPFSPGRDRILAVLPLWHPLVFTLATNVAIAVGSELMLTDKLTGEAAFSALKDYPPTVLMASSALIEALLLQPGLTAASLSSLRYLVVVGGALQPASKSQLAALTPAPALECYGLGIAPTLITLAQASDKSTQSQGLPLPATTIVVRDMADPEREVPHGERGEVCVRGPQVVTPDQLQPAVGALLAGDVRTGDLGLIDASGQLCIVDRVDDLIVAAGYLIYPRRIEHVLMEHPAIETAAVIGVADARRGQAPKAFIVVRRGQALTQEAVMAFAENQLSKIEVPCAIDFRQSLPRDAFGLVCKSALRQLQTP